MREWVGPEVELCFDFHGKFTPALAIEICHEIKGMRPMFVEEPVPQENVDALKLVSDHVPFPIATGERLLTRWGFREVLEKQAAALLQPDGSHAGGISELKKIANMAEVYYVHMMPHCAIGPVALMACLQVDAAVPNFLIQEQIDQGLGEGMLVEPLVVKDGYIELPTKPGLGIEIDEAFLKEQATYREELGGEHFYESDGAWRTGKGSSMKICMVGTGRMAASHSHALGALSDVQLHTVINPNIDYAEAFAREHGYERGLASLDQALRAGGFDAVVICTPNTLHYSQSAAALCAGRHVLTELPLAMSLAEAEELGRLAQEQDRRLMVCHTERYEAGRIELRRRIRAGEFHPLHLVMRFWMLRRGQLLTEQAHHGWTDSALWHHGSHVVDAVMDILGPHEAQGLSAQFGPLWPALGAPLDLSLQWRATSPFTGDDALVEVSLSHNAHWGAHDYHVIGTEDDLVSTAGELRNKDGVIVERPPYHTAVQGQDAEFVAAVREGRAPALDVEAVLPTLRILQAAWDRRPR